MTQVDIPVLLNSTPQETLEHRRSRARDGKVDSPFTMMVLELEQNKLVAQAHKAKIIVSKQGEIISYDDFKKFRSKTDIFSLKINVRVRTEQDIVFDSIKSGNKIIVDYRTVGMFSGNDFKVFIKDKL